MCVCVSVGVSDIHITVQKGLERVKEKLKEGQREIREERVYTTHYVLAKAVNATLVNTFELLLTSAALNIVKCSIVGQRSGLWHMNREHVKQVD